jgi:integrase
MGLLQSGEHISMVALWLGHESPTTSHHYTEANLAMKEKALARLRGPGEKLPRFRASDSLLAFLKTL